METMIGITCTTSSSTVSATNGGASAGAGTITTTTTTTYSSTNTTTTSHGTTSTNITTDSANFAVTSSGTTTKLCGKLHGESGKVEAVADEFIDSKEKCEEGTPNLRKSSLSSQVPVPNFRVVGNEFGGDSSITVSVGVLTSHSNSLIKSDNECSTSLVDSSSLGIETETEEPGVTTASTNGDILSSLQSSEPDEMPLSLVSWYSEPGDCSSSSTHCCQHSDLANSKLSSTIGSELSDVVNNSVINSTSVTPTTTTVVNHNELLSEEKENKTPSTTSLIHKVETTTTPAFKEKPKGTRVKEQQCSSDTVPLSKKTNTSEKQATSSDLSKRNKMHVQVYEQTSEINHNSETSGSQVEHKKDGKHKLECPKCARRSKSGTNTPATAQSRSSSSRRVASHHHHNANHQSLANCTSNNVGSRELKKPIKSILKSEPRSGGSGGSGSGSEKQSSMDSLGSNSGVNTMTRSDTGPRAKFYINNSSDNISYPEDKTVTKLKRIEKYATVRLSRKTKNAKQLPDDTHCRERTSSGSDSRSDSHCIPDLMTKSMSFLEKSSGPPSQQSRNVTCIASGTSSLKRQGSLKLRKPSPGWEPGATRTSALRLLKMQENKARSGSHSIGYYPGTSGSTHSGSGESIQFHHALSANTQTSRSSGSSHHHHQYASRGSANTSNNSTSVKDRGHSSAKVFAKLSSAQTASSSMKRLRQEKAIQTDEIISSEPVGASSSSSCVIDACSNVSSTTTNNNTFVNSTKANDSPNSSPEPIIFDASLTINALDQQSEQIKHLENLVKRYKKSALRFQKEFERTENKNIELNKQLQETQMESSEMLEFLQAEKSTLAESLVEVEMECKKLTRELESVVKESQSRCSSLVRLSEQHKQEALKSETLLHRVEAHKNAIITQQRTQLTKGTEAIRGIKQTILNLIENLMKTYKVSQERLAMDGFGDGAGINVDETELRCTLLVPLIKSLSKAFEVTNQQLKITSNKSNATASSTNSTTIISNHSKLNNTTLTTNSTSEVVDSQVSVPPPAATSTKPNSNNISAEESNNQSTNNSASSISLQNLNQAILEREKAETIGLDSICGTTTNTNNTTSSVCQTDSDFILHEELEQLQVALRKLCTVIRIIVIHCDQKVSNVASNILQVLKAETDKLDLDLDATTTARGQKFSAKIS